MKKTLHICHINSCKHKGIEGSNSVGLIKGLTKRGHKISFFYRETRGDQLREKVEALNPEKVMPLHLTSRFNPIKDIKDKKTISRYVEENKVDILHVHRGKEHWTTCFENIPVVRTRHTSTPVKKHFLNKWLYQKRTAAVMPISDNVGRPYIRNLGMDPRRVVTVYGGVDTDKFNPHITPANLYEEWCIPHDSSIVTMVARLRRDKNFEGFLQMAKYMIAFRPNTKFLAVTYGDSLEESKIRNYTESLGIGDSVILTGFRDDIPAIMAASDVGVITSNYSDGASRAGLEFMAIGKPVISTCVGVIPEYITEPDLIFPIGDMEGIGKKVLELLSSPEKRFKIGRKARERIENHFSWDKIAERVERIYYNLSEGRFPMEDELSKKAKVKKTDKVDLATD